MQRKEYFLILHDIKTKLWVAQATAHQAKQCGQLTPTELTAWNALRDATNEVDRIMLEENDRRAGRI